MLVLILSSSEKWKSNTSCHIFISLLVLYSSPEILPNFLLKLPMSPCCRKILKLIVFRLPENFDRKFSGSFDNWFFYSYPQEKLSPRLLLPPPHKSSSSSSRKGRKLCKHSDLNTVSSPPTKAYFRCRPFSIFLHF